MVGVLMVVNDDNVDKANVEKPEVVINDENSVFSQTETKSGTNNRLVMFFLLLAGLLVAGLASFFIFTKATQILNADAEAVINSISNLKSLDSAEVEFDLKLTDSTGTEDMTLAADGTLLIGNDGARLDLAIGLEGDSIDASIVIAEGGTFISFDGVSKLLSSGLPSDEAEFVDELLAPYQNRWIGISSSDLSELGVNSSELFDTSDQDLDQSLNEFVDLTISSGAFDVTTLESEKSLGSTKLNGYLISSDPEKTQALISDIITSIGQNEAVDQTEIEETIQAFSEMFSESSGSLPVLELWTDGTYFRQLVIGDKSSDQYFVVTVTGVNTDPEIVIPEAELSIQDVIEDFLTLFLGLGASI